MSAHHLLIANIGKIGYRPCLNPDKQSVKRDGAECLGWSGWSGDQPDVLYIGAMPHTITNGWNREYLTARKELLLSNHLRYKNRIGKILLTYWILPNEFVICDFDEF